MQKISERMRALHKDKRGQINFAGAFLGLLVALIIIAVVALVVQNVLSIAGLTTGLWTLDDLLLSVLFVLTIVVAMIVIIARVAG